MNEGKRTVGRVIFVTGIDTNIGKTYATAFLARLLSAEGLRVSTQKMVQTGCSDRSEDIETHRRLLRQSYGAEDQLGLTCPYLFSYPASPHLAAEIDGRDIDPDRIDEATNRILSQGYDAVVVEGAGGLMVPITRSYLTVDYIVERRLPIALVTGGRLGSINHTLLSLEVCRSRGIEVEYLIYNRFLRTDSLIEEDTYRYMEHYLQEHHPDARLIDMPIFD